MTTMDFNSTITQKRHVLIPESPAMSKDKF
jgi:hypothetical protein